jgi:hypothetical protein
MPPNQFNRRNFIGRLAGAAAATSAYARGARAAVGDANRRISQRLAAGFPIKSPRPTIA